MDEREAWLHGWPRIGEGGTSVLIGTSVRCAGCGRFGGVICVALTDEDAAQAERPLPDWPFLQDGCPVCHLRDMSWEPSPPAPWPKGKARPLP